MGAYKILIVDDDADFTDATSAVLEAAGFAVSVAHNGDDGLALARVERPDLIILDVMMSYLLEGLTVGEQLAADPSLAKTPVLMVSAIAQTEHLDKFPTDQPLPARFFLTKPIPATQLLETVRWMLTEPQEEKVAR